MGGTTRKLPWVKAFAVIGSAQSPRSSFGSYILTSCNAWYQTISKIGSFLSYWDVKIIGENALIRLKGYQGWWPFFTASCIHFEKKSQKSQDCEVDCNQSHFVDGLRLVEAHAFVVKTDPSSAALRFNGAVIANYRTGARNQSTLDTELMCLCRCGEIQK